MADQQPSRRELGFYFSLAQVGLEMVVPVVLGIFIDIYIKKTTATVLMTSLVVKGIWVHA